jgi:membrane associated rhomboid family serine protease
MQSQLYVPPLSKTNKFLIILSVVIYFADIAFTHATERTLTSILGLSWNGFSSGFIFQLVTFPFVSDSFFSVLFNGLCLWFIGSDLETTWGSRFYQRFLLAMVLFTGIIYLSFVALFFARIGFSAFNRDDWNNICSFGGVFNG